MNTGDKIIKSKNKLLSTVCYRIDNKTTYALEGSIFVAGAAIQWLRDKLKIIKNANLTEKISRKQKNNNNLYLVPAFTGLGAPYWKPDARGTLVGITRDTERDHVIRATLESIAYQSSDLLNAMQKDGVKPLIVKVDGGMVQNNWLMQFISDVLNLPIYRPKVHETTALGAALIAGYGIGIYKSLSYMSKKLKYDKKFYPKMAHKKRFKLLNGWSQAIRKSL